MLKHSNLTDRRIEQFIEALKPSLWSDPEPLKIEFSPQPYKNQSEAAAGKWKPTHEGMKWGPAYRTVWFRASGAIPKSWAGKSVVARLNLGGERTIWRQNSPVWGVDFAHDHYRITPSAKGGEKVELYVEAYGGNPDVRVHGTPPPRHPEPFAVEEVALRTFDEDLWQLYLDFKFAFDLLKALPDGDVVREHLRRGLNEAINIFDPTRRETFTLAKKTLAEATASRRTDNYHRVTPVGHAHLDTAWLWPLDITVKKMAHTTANQLALMDRYSNYRFVHSQPAQYEWLEAHYPKLFERVKQKISKRQWEPLGSLWVECDTNVPNGESLVRQFLYGKRYFQNRFGIETKDMWLPDCFGYSAALPQILKKSGVDYFFTQKISWNQFNKFPHNTFFWQGIDGTKVWSHFPPSDTYTGNADPAQLRRHLFEHKDHARCDQALYVYGWGDGGGGPTEEQIEMLNRATKAPGMPQIQWRRAIDFFQDAEANSKDLATWVGELYFELHRGTYTSQAANKKQNRVCEFLLRDAEWLNAFHPKFPSAYPSAEIEAAWKTVLLNQFHDILPGSSVEEVYNDSAKQYAQVNLQCELLIESALNAFAEGADTAATEKPCLLFSSAETGGETRIRAPKGAAPNSVRCDSDIQPVQAVEQFGEKFWLFETPAGALGKVALADFSKQEAPPLRKLKVSPRKLESDTLSVSFDAHGNITSVRCTEDQTEFIAQDSLANMLQIFDDKPTFWSAWDVDLYAYETMKEISRCERFEIVERGPVRVAVEVERKFGDSRIIQRISLGPTPGVRFDTWIDWRETEKMLKVAFPVNIHSPRATFEIQFGSVERPTHYNTSWDMAKFEVCAHKYVDLSEGAMGVALLNDGKYGFDVHQNVMRMTLLRSPKAPDPNCDMGEHRFSYVLMPHFGPHNWAGVAQAAYALNCPTRHLFCTKHPGKPLADQKFVQCPDTDIVIESVKKAEDGNGVIVRAYECHNSRGIGSMWLAKKAKRAYLCDLLENPIQELEVENNTVQFEYTPFTILTFRFDG